MIALALAIGTLACIASYGLGILTHAVLMAIVSMEPPPVTRADVRGMVHRNRLN